MNTHADFMTKALAQARIAAEKGEVPVGAAVVHEGKVIALAHNLRETLCDPTAHAEVLALRQAAEVLGRRRLHGCTLYVTLEPCPMCAGAVLMAALDACVFAAYDPLQGCCGSVYHIAEDPAFTHRVPTTGGVLEAEAKALLDGFFAGRRQA